MQKYRIVILLIFLCTFTNLFANKITFLTHEIKPFTYVNNDKVNGFAIEIVTSMMKINKHPIKFDIYPFKRALYTVQNRDNYALFIVAKRPERIDTLKWVGPLITSGVYFYKRKDNNIILNTLDDARKVNTIGIALGNADHTYLKDLGFNNLRAPTTQRSSIHMLYLNRVDIAPSSELVVPEILKTLKLNKEFIERTDVKLYDSTLYLVFSKNVSDKVVKKWQDALDTLKANGTYEEIYNRYIN